MRRRQALINPAIILDALVAVCVPLYVQFGRARAEATEDTCVSNLKMLYAATEMYAAQHGGRLPDASEWWRVTGELGATRERCLDDDTDQEGSYALSPRWSGAVLKKIPGPAHTVLLYESDYGRPAYRHRKGMNVRYADGHASWVKELPAEALGGP